MKFRNSLYLSVVVPAFNEEKRIGFSLFRIKDYLQSRNISAEVIVVDDGSTDRTAEEAGEIMADYPEFRVITLPVNRGKGAAVRSGVLQARGELVLFTDADLSTPIEELEKFLPLAREGCQVVIGSRALPESQIKERQGWLREHLGKFFNLLVRLLVLKGFKDTQCGFKLFRKEAAREIFLRLETEGFAFDVEVLLLAQKLGYKICQVPVVWVNHPESRVRLVRGSLEMLGELLRIRRKKKGDIFIRP
ncbi:MAG: glycosyltransferase family 2 protein [Candidatus Saccharicenans sp.]|nr:glycosyltransferase family 2 protein [Candidatus Saccharicenans sp.]MDH7493516.1 glycosyltransferase family 2 protein [Candidatus Saccharicenans sp.]